MEMFWQEQLYRIDRLLITVNLDDPPYGNASNITFFDIVIFTCQNMWHLKDWILNDINFRTKDKKLLLEDIHNSECLLICSDIANGSKHLRLKNKKRGGEISNRTGIEINTAKNIFKELYYIDIDNHKSIFYRMEIRDFLNECRKTWQKIINKHHYSNVIIK
jgi:hypothetical protein